MSRALEQAEFGPIGVVQDVPPFAAPPDVYTSVQNMRVAGAGMARAAGVMAMFQDVGSGVLFPPKWVGAVIRSGAIWVLYAGDGGVGVTDGTAHYNVTPSTGWAPMQPGEMMGGIYNGILIFNNPAAASPWYWDGGLTVGSVKPLPGWPSGYFAKAVAPFGSHIFAGSISAAGVLNDGRLLWSDVAVPGSVPASWTPTASNQAGEIFLSTGSGQIQSMLGLGSQLMVYRSTGCWAVSYVGRPYIYTHRKVAAEVGCCSTNAAVMVRGSHLVVTPGDIVLTDGTAVRSIGENRIKRTLFAQISEPALSLVHCYLLPTQSEVAIAIPAGQDQACNLAYVWDYAQDRWSIRELPDVAHTSSLYIPTTYAVDTWESDAGTWESDWNAWDSSPQGGFVVRGLAASAVHGRLFALDLGDLRYDGSMIEAMAERLSVPIAGGKNVAMVSRLFPRVTAPEGTRLTVQVGAQLDPSAPVTWEAEQPYTVGAGVGVNSSAIGRFISVRIKGAVLEEWAVAGWGVEFRTRGPH
jgi:hypothetical protein